MISTLQTRQFRVCLMNKSQLSTNLNKVFSQVARILLKECRKKAFINIFGQNASKNNKGKRRQGGKTWSFPNSEIPHKTFEQNFENSIVWLENSCFSTSHFWSPPPHTHTHNFLKFTCSQEGKKSKQFFTCFLFPLLLAEMFHYRFFLHSFRTIHQTGEKNLFRIAFRGLLFIKQTQKWGAWEDEILCLWGNIFRKTSYWQGIFKQLREWKNFEKVGGGIKLGVAKQLFSWNKRVFQTLWSTLLGSFFFKVFKYLIPATLKKICLVPLRNFLQIWHLKPISLRNSKPTNENHSHKRGIFISPNT